MKKLASLVLGFCVSTVVMTAQMNTGSKFVAGNSNFGMSSNSEKEKGVDEDPTKNFSLNLTTRGGYFLKNRLAIGGFASMGYDHSKYKILSFENKSTNTNWMIGPLVRYYTEYGGIIPFAEASVGFGMNKSKSEAYESNPFEEKHSVFGLKGGIGADYFLNESISLEGMASYYMNQLKPKTKGYSGEGHIQNGFELTFGVVFYFGAI